MTERTARSVRSHLVECPACGAPNPTNARTCWHCEAPTEPVDAGPGLVADEEAGWPRLVAKAAPLDPWPLGSGASSEADPGGSRSAFLRRPTVLAAVCVGAALALAALVAQTLSSRPAHRAVGGHPIAAAPAERPAAPASHAPATPAPLDARANPTAGEAQAAFGWPGAAASAAAEAPAEASTAVPQGCAVATAALGLCAETGSEQEKRP